MASRDNRTAECFECGHRYYGDAGNPTPCPMCGSWDVDFADSEEEKTFKAHKKFDDEETKNSQ